MALSPIVKILQSSDGTAIYAEAIGDPRHPAVVLMHGFALTSATFDNIFFHERLLEALYLVRYDLRGHGRSGMPSTAEGHHSSLYADDYATVMRAFGLKKVVHFAWSYGATVVADVCAHMHPHPFSGLVYVAPLPHMGSILRRVGTPDTLDLLPAMMSTDAVQHVRAKVTFVNSFFADPVRVDFNLKMSWVGQTVMQPPESAQCILSRVQDPENFLEAGRAGLPMLLLNGTADSVVMGDVVDRELSPYFQNLDVHMIEGGNHALFHDHQEECVDALLAFVGRVTTQDSKHISQL